MHKWLTSCIFAGQQPATQKKQDPSQGKVAREGDPKNAAPKYTTASAAWERGLVSSQGGYSSPAMAKGPWGQSRGFHSGAVLGYVKDKHERPDRGSDVGGIQDGSSDINTGVCTCCCQSHAAENTAKQTLDLASRCSYNIAMMSLSDH